MVSKLGGATTGGLSGAATGAAIGSVIPGVGTAIGAGAGGLIGAIGGYMSSGTKDKFRSILTKPQQQFQSNILGQLGDLGGPGGSYGMAQDYLKSLLSGDPGAYSQFASPYLQNFEQQIIPRLSERFAGLGGGLGGGTMGSSGFGQAIGGAGAQLQAQLAGLYANLRNQAAQQAMGQYNQLAAYGLQPSQAYQPGTPGFGGAALPGLMQGIGQGFGQAGAYNMMNRPQAAPNQNSSQEFSDADYAAMEAMRRQYGGY